MSSIFPDPKTFVDMKMKYFPNKTMNVFLDAMKNLGQRHSKFELETCLNDTFGKRGIETPTGNQSLDLLVILRTQIYKNETYV
jgi:hypothetical protein